MTLRVALTSVLSWIALIDRSGAHPDQQNAMWIQFEPTQIHMAVDVSLKELVAVWGISGDLQPSDDSSALQWAAEKHQNYILEHLAITEGEERLSGRVLKVSTPSKIGDPEKTFIQYELEYPFMRAPAKKICVVHDMLKEWPYAPETPWNIRYIVRTKSADSDAVRSWLLCAGEPMELNTGLAEETPKRQPKPELSPGPSFLKKTWQAAQHFFGW